MKLLLNLLLLLLSISISYSQTSIRGVVNQFSSVLDIEILDGKSIVTIDDTNGFSSCEKVLIIQMKGAEIDFIEQFTFGQITSINNAGNYEFALIQEIDGNKITFSDSLKRGYSPDHLVQIVSIPKFQSAQVDGLLTTVPWNGKTGGILIFEVEEKLILNYDIDVEGMGLKGGIMSNVQYPTSGCGMLNFGGFGNIGDGGTKGEGISIHITGTESGRGPWANGGGGGNSHNAGGGGGSNGGVGGQGGREWINCFSNEDNGGLGGIDISPFFSENKIFLGGGGGAGESNGNLGTSGASGGGIIIISSNEIQSNGNKIIAKGAAVELNATADGAGGGGGGGTILLDVENYIDNISIDATGGDGGNNNNGGSCVSPGGGGGGGLVWLRQSQQPLNVNILNFGGDSGLFINSNNNACFNTPFGAEPGSDGKLLFNANLVDLEKELSSRFDTLLCSSLEEIELIPNNLNGTDHLWNNGETKPSIFVNESGFYYVDYLSNSCLVSDSFIVKYFNPELDLGNDTSICAGTEFFLSADINDVNSYQWSTGSNESIIMVLDPGEYILTIQTECGELSDSIKIQFEDCDCEIKIPNIFSPNSDDRNDEFKILYEGCINVENVNLQIFNRWGQKVGELSDLDDTWDGSFNDQDLPTDVFVWVLKFSHQGIVEKQSGDLTLIR